MLEFIAFLTARDKEILDLIYKANYSVEENTPLCLLGKKFFGFLKKEQRTVVICTNNAKKYGGYSFTKNNQSIGSFKTGLMIRRALRHEAVHIAQECNGGNVLDILNKKTERMSPYKINALKGSVSLTGEESKEYEAYSMEDKPRKVKEMQVKLL